MRRTCGWCCADISHKRADATYCDRDCKRSASRARANGTERQHFHGLSGTYLYYTWRDMLRRCEDPEHWAYANYGKRDITVWEPWHDVETFVSDLLDEIGERPDGTSASGRALYSLDRIDNDRGYEPGNLRWATGSEQNENRRYASVLDNLELRARVVQLRQAGNSYRQIHAETGAAPAILSRSFTSREGVVSVCEA